MHLWGLVCNNFVDFERKALPYTHAHTHTHGCAYVCECVSVGKETNESCNDHKSVELKRACNLHVPDRSERVRSS